MKVGIALVCILCLFVCGCVNGSAYIYGSPEEEGTLGMRLGVEVVENLEVGAATYFDPWNDSDFERYGLYSLLHFPGDTVSPYIGGQVNIGEGCWDFEDTIQPIIGVSRGPVFIEWQGKDLNHEEDKFLIGTRIGF